MPIYTHAYYCQKAEALVRKYGFIDPPVDLRKIAADLGIEIVEMTLPSWFFGVLINMNGDFYIALNKAMPDYRKNFTLAHEIAHYELHGSELAYMKNCKRDYFHREADVFAAELCMPTFMVKKEAEKWYKDWRYLAHLFGVSETAMVRKMQEIGLLREGIFDCAT